MRHTHISGLMAATTAALIGLTLAAAPAGARLPDREVRASSTTTLPSQSLEQRLCCLTTVEEFSDVGLAAP